LDLFEWILKKNLKVIIKHVIEKYYSRIKENSSLYPSFKQLKDSNDDTPSYPVESPIDKTQSRLRPRQPFIDEREEDYFNTDSDSELSSTDRDTPKKRQLNEDEPLPNHNNNKENSHTKKRKLPNLAIKHRQEIFLTKTLL